MQSKLLSSSKQAPCCFQECHEELKHKFSTWMGHPKPDSEGANKWDFLPIIIFAFEK